MEQKTNLADFGTPAKFKEARRVSKVKVVVRVRPFLPKEVAAKNGVVKSCVSVLHRDQTGDNNEVTVYIKDPFCSRSESYQLDSFFDQEDDNVRKIFDREVDPLIPGIFEGCNATTFAYGATGSGKTYTMVGSEACPGLMPLAMSKVLSICKQTGSFAEISYYEVYMDRCYDLLEIKAKEISILDDKDGQIHLKGLSRVPISSMPEFDKVFSLGVQRRKVAHTGLNDVSSRSHGVLVILVSSLCSSGTESVIAGKMNLIDLAGNEDNRKTYNEGIRLQESAKINQSLFALANVISALNNNKPRVPYRESKLTRILQDSLGGTSLALMVACLNPGEYQESIHTVSLAARSRLVTNHIPHTPKMGTPKVKVDMEAKLRAWLESKGKSSQQLEVNGSQYVGRTLGCTSSVKKALCNSSVKADSIGKQRNGRVPPKNLFRDESTIYVQKERYLLSVDENNGERNVAIEGNTLEAKASLAGRILKKEDKTIAVVSDPCNDNPFNPHAIVENLARPDGTCDREMIKVQTVFHKEDMENPGHICEKELIRCEMKNLLHSPVRKALSPISLNVHKKPLEMLSSSDASCPTKCIPQNPTTPVTAVKNSQTDDGFGAWSSSIKSSFIQEYISFLNTASREELMELKGVGQKIADCILEIRRTNPLTKLTDLEKIGLSSKQVHNMLCRAARGILD